MARRRNQSLAGSGGVRRWGHSLWLPPWLVSAGAASVGAADELAEADAWRLLVEVAGAREDDLPNVMPGLQIAPILTARLRVLEDERSEILRSGSAPKMEGAGRLLGAGSLQTPVAGNGGAVGTNWVSINCVSGSMLLSEAPESQI